MCTKANIPKKTYITVAQRRAENILYPYHTITFAENDIHFGCCGTLQKDSFKLCYDNPTKNNGD